MTPYEKYCTDMRDRGLKPSMNEAQLHEAWGIKIEEEYTPLIARKSATGKKIEPTLSNHTSSGSSKPQLKVNLLDAPRPDTSELLEILEKRIKDKGKRKPPKPKAVRDPKPPRVLTRKPNCVPKTSLKGMSEEEKKAHKNRLKKEYYLRCKEEGKVYVRNEEQLQRQREYSKAYYVANQESEKQKRKDRLAAMSEEKRAALKEAQLKWQRENRDRVNANARAWKKQNREKRLAKKREYDLQKRESSNNTSLSQKVS